MVLICQDCSKPLTRRAGRGRPLKRCADCAAAARRLRERVRLRCLNCGGPTGYRPDQATHAVCRSCRGQMAATDWLALGQVRGKRKMSVWFPTCEQCGKVFCSKRRDVRFCSPMCVGLARRIRSESDTRVQRHQRDSASPGLTTRERRELLRMWKRQCRSCVYCWGACETIDHVVPLVRGGTSYEGNLVPCCRACNSAKGARLLVEWRAGRPAGRTSMSADWRPRIRRVKVWWGPRRVSAGPITGQLRLV
jgi:5-methylcytosine-specific restriction endonuclease McrA